MAQGDRGFYWWIRFVVVPLVGSGGLVAIIVALIIRPSTSSRQDRSSGQIVAAEEETDHLFFELQSLRLEKIGDAWPGDKSPTRVELYVDERRVVHDSSLDIYGMRNGQLAPFESSSRKANLGQFPLGFADFALRIDVIDIDDDHPDRDHPVLGRFRIPVKATDVGAIITPSGEVVPKFGEKNAEISFVIRWI